MNLNELINDLLTEGDFPNAIIKNEGEAAALIAKLTVLIEQQAPMIALAYMAARLKHRPLNGAHEAYAVLLEEVDELWDAIKADDLEAAKKEAAQVGAMALAFLAEVN